MTDTENLNYFHVFSHPDEAGYFHFWINYKNPEEYSRLFGKNEDGKSFMFDGYNYLFSLPLPHGYDWREFKNYVAEVMRDTEQIDVEKGPAYKVDIRVMPQQLMDNYSAWKKEKEQQQRTLWEEQAQKESKGQYSLF